MAYTIKPVAGIMLPPRLRVLLTPRHTYSYRECC